MAKMVHTLFESILGNKVMEERLQKAAGRRHTKARGTNGASTAKDTAKISPNENNEPSKRKYEDMEFGYSNGPPAAPMSYERSRPQSPAVTPSRELPQQNQHQQQVPQISTSSPPQRHSTDAFMGNSRANTRPTTPFNSFSIPGTPPDLFLHTRNSPKISEDLWQNYHPDQLFPPETNGLFPLQSPSQNMVDPALRGPPQQQQFGMPSQVSMQDGMQMYGQDPNSWSHVQTMQAQGGGDDTWSTSSTSGPIVPTALNVGDWLEFFGIPNGDINSLNGLTGYA